MKTAYRTGQPARTELAWPADNDVRSQTGYKIQSTIHIARIFLPCVDKDM